MDRSFLIDDPKLVDEIVYEVKSQGVFDQFRRNCIADVDTKPAYQNLRQRVENIVSTFLNDQVWQPDLNKNQSREKLRKHITEAGFLETGVERIVDQVVNPKINSIFLPKIEDISYKYLGIEKPKQADDQSSNSGQFFGGDLKHFVKNTLPTDLDFDDLEAVSPDSTSSKKSFKDLIEDANTSNIDSNKTDLNDSGEKTEDDFESPAFEPLKSCLLTDPDSINGDDNSKLSDISGLTSQDSVNSAVVENETQETKVVAPTIEIVEQPAVTQSQQVIPENINQDSVLLDSVSSNSHLSIVTDSNNKSSEVDICEEAQMPKFSENSCNNPDMDDKDKKPLLTSFDIKQDEIIFEGTERHSAIHDLKDDVKMEVDDVIEEFKDSTQILDSIGDESLIKTESSSSFIDPIICETKDLSLKDECKSVDSEFKFEEPILSADTVDTNQSQNDKNKSKDGKSEKRSDGKHEHKSHRRDKSSSSHHSREKHKDNERKHSSSSSKHSSNSSSGRKDHRSESRETKKSSSSDHKRDESSKSTDRSSAKTASSSHSSNRDKDGNHKSSRSHSDDKSKDRSDKEKSDKSRSKQDRSNNSKSRSQHRSSDDKLKHRTHDDNKRKSGQDSTSKPKMIDDHASHREKHIERRRSTDRDSNDGSAPNPPKASSINTQAEVSSVDSSAISNSTFSSTASTGTDDQLKREMEMEMQQQNVVNEIERSVASSSDSGDNFVPSSVPVVVDQILIGNDIDLEMLMDKNSVAANEMNPVMSMITQSLNESNEMKIKKPKVASDIFEARKLMKVRKQMDRDQKKRMEKLLVATKQTVAATQYGVDEQGVELEFALTSSSAPSISSPVKSKDIHIEGVPAPVTDQRNSGEFVIDLKEMEKEMKSGKLSPRKGDRTPTIQRVVHKFDECLSQIDKPRKRESKGGTSPVSPSNDKSPKFESPQKKLIRDQSSLEAVPLVDNKKLNKVANAASRQCRDEKKIDKSFQGTVQDSSNLKKNSECPESAVRAKSHSPPMLEQKMRKSNKTVTSSTSAVKPAKYDSTKHQKLATTSSKATITQNILPKHDEKASDEDKTDEFYGFACDALMGKTENDFVTFREMYTAKINDRIVYVMNCEPMMCNAFLNQGKIVWDVSGNEKRLISEKYEPELIQQNNSKQSANQVSGDNTFEMKEMKTNIASINGSRTTTAQHKLFVENNQFADKMDGQKVSRKRKNSDSGQGTAAKLVKLPDTKMNRCENTDVANSEQTSLTPSEQFKENQIHKMKKPIASRVIDNVSTSNDFTTAQDQHSTGRIGSNSKPNQRYKDDDLYKPRPLLSRTRRRGLENGEN